MITLKKKYFFIILCIFIFSTVIISFQALANHKTPLDVPLESQFEGEPLGNGCEVTALSMLLRFYDFDTNKNDLANRMTYVPVKINEEYHGNPAEGFVGDIAGGNQAMGVAVEPIKDVAEQVIKKKVKVNAGRNITFAKVEEQINKGNPVWVLTTTNFEMPETSDYLHWETTSGPIVVNRLCHSVVVTGVTADKVWVNDPFGKKDVSIDKERFIRLYKIMGSQALYLN